MGTSRLTILGFALLAWGGVLALAAAATPDAKFSTLFLALAIGSATGGLATAIVGAARHESI